MPYAYTANYDKNLVKIKKFWSREEREPAKLNYANSLHNTFTEYLKTLILL